MSIQDRVRDAFAGQGLMGTLKAELTHVADGQCWISVPFSSLVTQQHGLFHGGVTATLADNAAGFAGYTLMNEDEEPLSVEFKISFVAPARGDRLEARAEVVRSGRRLKHVRADVYAMDGEAETLVGIALATIASTRSVRRSPAPGD